jgi:hypothetical protein
MAAMSHRRGLWFWNVRKRFPRPKLPLPTPRDLPPLGIVEPLWYWRVSPVEVQQFAYGQRADALINVGLARFGKIYLRELKRVEAKIPDLKNLPHHSRALRYRNWAAYNDARVMNRLLWSRVK